MKKAERQGLISNYSSSGRTWKESIYYYAVQFDGIGILLIATGLSLFLLSFSSYSYQAEQWKSPLSSLEGNSFRLYQTSSSNNHLMLLLTPSAKSANSSEREPM